VLDPEIVFAVDGAVVLAIDLEEAERRARRMSLSWVGEIPAHCCHSATLPVTTRELGAGLMICAPMR
jgi:hypothetical protein